MDDEKIFPAKVEYLHDMLSFIQNYGLEHHMSINNLNKIILASEEALVNIISYSYVETKESSIEITCEICEGPGIKIIIKDQGIPFNPIKQFQESSQGVLNHSDRIGGYGIYIFIKMMDNVEYQRLGEKNVLSFTKYIEKNN